MFVLKHILAQPAEQAREMICGMAFGPGLTVETGLFTKVGPPASVLLEVGQTASAQSASAQEELAILDAEIVPDPTAAPQTAAPAGNA